MPLNLDPRNAIPVLELAPNLAVSEIFNRLTISAVSKTIDANPDCAFVENALFYTDP